MPFDWMQLITTIRSLLEKVRNNTATVSDWVEVAYLVISALRLLTSPPVIGCATAAATLDHDPAFSCVEEEEAFTEASIDLIEELSGEPLPTMADGRLLKLLLPLLIKYLLPLLIAQPGNTLSDTILALLEKLAADHPQ